MIANKMFKKLGFIEIETNDKRCIFTNDKKDISIGFLMYPDSNMIWIRGIKEDRTRAIGFEVLKAVNKKCEELMECYGD